MQILFSEKYSKLGLFKTDNDQKTLAIIRDNTLHIKAYCKDKSDKLKAVREFFKYSLNSIPIGTRKYWFAKEIMAEEIKNNYA